jgi:hypothetical protein
LIFHVYFAKYIEVNPLFRIQSSRRKSDAADSSIVSALFIIPLFLTVLFTMIDVSVYFSNRSTVQQVARDGARTVAIFGGNGTIGPCPNTIAKTAGSACESPLEDAYGSSTACATLGTLSTKAVNRTNVECQVISRLDAGAGLTNVEIVSVACGPGRATAVGETTWCNVNWNYGGIPASTMGFIKSKSGNSPFDVNETRVTGQSEVNMSGIPFNTR